MQRVFEIISTAKNIIPKLSFAKIYNDREKFFEASTLSPKYSDRQIQEQIHPWKELSLAEVEPNVVVNQESEV